MARSTSPSRSGPGTRRGLVPVADGRGRDRVRRCDPRHVEPELPQDPGKVTDAEYHCAPRRRRRPHELGRAEPRLRTARGRRNVQRQTVRAIGMTKAAHLYWRAQSVYQTPTSDFNDHADALEASCTDLIGVTLEALSTGPTAGPVRPGDHPGGLRRGERHDRGGRAPDRPPSSATSSRCCSRTRRRCAEPEEPADLLPRGLRGRPRGWTLTNTGVFAGWPGTNWTQDDNLAPGGRSGPRHSRPIGRGQLRRRRR